MEVQMTIDGAPRTNELGAARGRAQVDRVAGPDWTFEFDPSEDTLFARKRGAGAAISYWEPAEPAILYRLDRATGELVGLDLTAFRKTLAPKYPPLADVYHAYRTSRVMRLLPWTRRLAPYLMKGAEVEASQELSRELCHQGVS